MVRVFPTLLVAGVYAISSAVTNAQANFKCHGINYNIRAGPDWAPNAEKCKPADQIQKELATLKTVTDRVRLYSLNDCDQVNAVVPAAIAAGLKVELGIWVGPEASVFEAEKATLQKAIQNTEVFNTDNILGIHVGSEALYRGDVNVTTAIQNMQEIKSICQDAGMYVPVTIADVAVKYMEFPELFGAVDFVSFNMFPFWDGEQIGSATDIFFKNLADLEGIAAGLGKEVIIGETGWPFEGTAPWGGVASDENAAKYFHDFYLRAKEHKLKYFYFAGFDEPWKLTGHESNHTVEASFGLFDVDGALKPSIADLVLDDESDYSSAGSDLAGSSSDESSSSSDCDGVPPTDEPTPAPTYLPMEPPTHSPTNVPSEAPTDAPRAAPSNAPTNEPGAPTDTPKDLPSSPPSTHKDCNA